MLKRLFYSSAIILMLAIAYSLGARNVQAQTGTQAVGYVAYGSKWFVVHENGDVYYREWDPPFGQFTGDFVYMDNIWRGSTVNVQPETWTGMKEKYRK